MKNELAIKKLTDSINDKNVPENLKVIFRKKISELEKDNLTTKDKIVVKTGKNVKPVATSSIEELDRKFAEKAGITYDEYQCLSKVDQSNLRIKITNEELSKQKSKIIPSEKKQAKTIKVKQGVYKINGKQYDLTKLELPDDHPIMILDSDSSQWRSSVEEYFEKESKDTTLKAVKSPKEKIEMIPSVDSKLSKLKSIKILSTDSKLFNKDQVFNTWNSLKKVLQEWVNNEKALSYSERTMLEISWSNNTTLKFLIELGKNTLQLSNSKDLIPLLKALNEKSNKEMLLKLEWFDPKEKIEVPALNVKSTKQKIDTVIPAKVKIIPLKEIKIEWSESDFLQGQPVFKSWNALQKICDKIVKEELPDGGYLKTKMTIIWEDESKLVDRVDFGHSEHDYHGQEEIGIHIKESSAMYASSIQQGTRSNLQWQDNKVAQTASKVSKKTDKKAVLVKPKKSKSEKQRLIDEIISSTSPSNLARDKARTAKKPGKRISKDGEIYYEYRRNRSDINPKKRI